MSQQTSENAIEFLQHQHEAARQLLEAVTTTTGEARRQIFESLVRLLAVHETAEEMVIWPFVRAAGDEGARITEARLAEEDRSKKVLSELEGLDLDSAEFDELFAELRTAVEAHADSEEREAFPLLAQTTSEPQLRRMASGLKLAERIAPTHPHKAAPESATGNLLVGPMVSMVDRVRDAIRDATR
jgi:hemerythrin superfamily protein